MVHGLIELGTARGLVNTSVVSPANGTPAARPEAHTPSMASRASSTDRAGIIALVPDPWIDRWSTRHQVLTRLAERFPVVWMNPAHEWREIPGRFHGVPVWSMPLADHPNFTVYTPHAWLPTLYNPSWLAAWTARRRLAHARQWLAERGCNRIIISIWTPQYADALELVPYDVSSYHVDDEYSFSETETPVGLEEQALLGRVDQVFVHSAALMEKRGPYARRIAFTPNGVDYDAYATRVPEPADIRDIPHPRVGYAGYIKQQIDWELMLEVATRRSEWSFVLVGYRSPHPQIADVLARLDALPNVYFLGSKSTSTLAMYPQHFDVCVMPYRVSAYTQYINPLKLREYLASGRPAVGPPIPSLQGIPEISLASTADEWEAAIVHGLTDEAQNPAQVAARQTLAKTMDWRVIVDQIGDALAERLDAARTQPSSR